MHLREDPHVSETSPSDWKYIAEGGATLVLSYDGAPNPKFDGKVLRLRKADIHAKFEETAEFWSEPDDPIIEFQDEVVERLIPPENLPELQAVSVEHSWLVQIAALVEERRPAKRRAKDKIDLTRHKAVLATDLIGGKGWAVEIKPKWGFLPSPTYLSGSSRSIKTSTCRFCMHTHYRISQGEKQPYSFCPLDLYSEDESRLTKALHGLWEGWMHSEGAANNLRIFVEGITINPSQESSLAILAEKMRVPGAEESPDDLRDAFVAALRPLLLASPLLPTIARLQRTLDSLDVEGIHALLDRAGVPFSKEELEKDVNANSVFVEPDVAEWIKFVSTYQSRQRKARQGATESPQTEDIRYHTLAYLLSMSFKDCSVISNLHPDRSRPDSITIIDLDPKTVRKLSQWERLDAEIVRAYARVPEKMRRRCIDAHALPPTQQANDVSSTQFLIIVTVLITLLSYALMP